MKSCNQLERFQENYKKSWMVFLNTTTILWIFKHKQDETLLWMSSDCRRKKNEKQTIQAKPKSTFSSTPITLKNIDTGFTENKTGIEFWADFCYFIGNANNYSTVFSHDMTSAKSLPSTIGVTLCIVLTVTLGIVLTVTLCIVSVSLAQPSLPA